MALERKNFTTPPGRLVQGDLYTPNTTDAENRPLVVKNGPNAGQPRSEFFIALAIKKGAEPHWAHTEWGGQIWQAGHAFLAHAGQLPYGGFAWKVIDGDSQVPGKGTPPRRPCDMTGFPGHWILRMSGGFQPGLHSLVGVPPGGSPQQLTAPRAINLGDYVQVNLDAVGNGSTQQPGVYLNPNMVCLVGYGERIATGPDVAAAGFGGQPLPQGAMAAPPGGFNPAAAPGGHPLPPGVPGGHPAPLPPGAMGQAPAGLPSAPGGYPQPPGLPHIPPIGPGPGTPAAPAGYPAPPGFATPGAPGGIAMPASPSSPTGGYGAFGPDGRPVGGPPLPPQNPAFLQPPPVARQMTAAAQGTYEAYIAQGWTDVQLRQNGLMV